MSLTKVGVTSNQSYNVTTTVTHTHTVPSGSDRLLLINIAYRNNANITNITYNGVAMSLVNTSTFSSISGRFSTYALVNPDVGTYNVALTFSASVGSILIHGQSFNGAESAVLGNSASLANTPHSLSFTASQNSLVFCAGTSQYQFSNTAITIDGVVTSEANCDMNGVSYLSQVRGETSTAPLTAGSVTCITDTIANSYQASIIIIEIKEKTVVPPITTRRTFIF